MNSKRKLVFDDRVFEEFMNWASEDRKIFLKIGELIREIQRTPFEGTGKPEPLKHQLKGFWSRRITQEHRLIYEVTNEEIRVISCRGHYG